MGAKIQREFSLDRVIQIYSIMYSKDTFIFESWNKFTSRSRHISSHTVSSVCLQARLLGNSYWFSLKIVPFRVTFVLCCCSQAENMPTGVLITHILAVAGLASGSSFKGTQQQNIFIPCFPLQVQKSSSSPVNMIIQSNVLR